MRVPPGEKRDEALRARPRGPGFLQALRGAPAPKPAPLHVPAGLRCHLSTAVGLRGAAARPLPGSAEGLRALRQGMHGEVQRLGEVRSLSVGQGEQQREQRAVELIARELVRELPREVPGVPAPGPRLEPTAAPSAAGDGGEAVQRVGAGGGRGAAPAAAPSAQLRAEAAVALIERIELFVRSGRPAMALSVGGSLAATVEVERTGPREVALRIQGRRGPPAPAELAQVRAALAERGLRLRSLQVS
jgi:hypothetical protein